jgi:hypothetical protein
MKDYLFRNLDFAEHSSHFSNSLKELCTANPTQRENYFAFFFVSSLFFLFQLAEALLSFHGCALQKSFPLFCLDVVVFVFVLFLLSVFAGSLCDREKLHKTHGFFLRREEKPPKFFFFFLFFFF